MKASRRQVFIFKNNYQSAYSKFAWKSIKYSGAYKPKKMSILIDTSGVFPAIKIKN